jgi:hypothetical protein
MTEAAYGPILLLCCWANGYKEPLHLVTNMASADEACRYYAKRFRIETFFSAPFKFQLTVLRKPLVVVGW